MNQADNDHHSDTTFVRALKDTQGAGLVEYIILVALIGLVAMAGFETFGEKVNTKAEDLGDQVEDIGG